MEAHRACSRYKYSVTFCTLRLIKSGKAIVYIVAWDLLADENGQICRRCASSKAVAGITACVQIIGGKSLRDVGS